MERLRLVVEEPVYGASTSAEIIIVNDEVKQFIDTSDGPQHEWDGWGNYGKFIGMSTEDLYMLMSCWFWEYSKTPYSPKVVIHEIQEVA